MLKYSAIIGAGWVGLASLLATSQASAHAYLKESIPAADSAVPAPKQIMLHLSEKLLPQFSGFDVSFGGAPFAVKARIVGDQMIGVPAKPLRAGVYQVRWHAVTADTHRMEGTYTFTVR